MLENKIYERKIIFFSFKSYIEMQQRKEKSKKFSFLQPFKDWLAHTTIHGKYQANQMSFERHEQFYENFINSDFKRS